eukprot:4535006-Pyramimonas_sp.AAC.1
MVSYRWSTAARCPREENLALAAEEPTSQLRAQVLSFTSSVSRRRPWTRCRTPRGRWEPATGP